MNEMTAREDTIERIEKCLKFTRKLSLTVTIPRLTAERAVSMLKEQEAKQVDLYGNDEWRGLVWICPDCNAEWMTDKENVHFCPNCGRKVKSE